MSENFPELRRRGELLPAPDSRGGGLPPDAFAASADPLPARQLDEFVDLVVERIEQRVIDELERRGRRGNPGGF